MEPVAAPEGVPRKLGQVDLDGGCINGRDLDDLGLIASVCDKDVTALLQ